MSAQDEAETIARMHEGYPEPECEPPITVSQHLGGPLVEWDGDFSEPYGRCPRHGYPYTPGENCPECDAVDLQRIGDHPAVRAVLNHSVWDKIFRDALMLEIEPAEPDISDITRKIARGA